MSVSDVFNNDSDSGDERDFMKKRLQVFNLCLYKKSIFVFLERRGERSKEANYN